MRINTNILFINSVCVVVNKLAGQAMEGASGDIIDLPKILKAQLKTDFVEAVHRLDVPVTGCALFALNKSSLEFLNDVFVRKIVEKRYWAIVEKPDKEILEKGELVHYLEFNSKTNKSFAYNEDVKGRKKAVLSYKKISESDNYLFLEVTIHTGRHHQIRAQLAAIGLHIKGDLKYGAKRSEKNGGIRLHARSLVFPNPLNPNEKINITADPPQMDNLWEAFKNCLVSRFGGLGFFNSEGFQAGARF